VLLPVSSVTSLDVTEELARPPTTVRVGQLEWPESSGGLLEVGSTGGELVDEVLHTDHTVLAELLLDDGVVGDRDSLTVDLGVTTLVDELTDGLKVDLSVGDVWADKVEHLLGGLGDSDKDTVVDLKETEKLEDLLWLGGNLRDTLQPDNEVDLGLGSDVEVTSLAGLSLKSDLLLLLVLVLLDILIGTLEDDLSLGDSALEISTRTSRNQCSDNMVQPRKMVNFDSIARRLAGSDKGVGSFASLMRWSGVEKECEKFQSTPLVRDCDRN
jgi:hypothetical protein